MDSEVRSVKDLMLGFKPFIKFGIGEALVGRLREEKSERAIDSEEGVTARRWSSLPTILLGRYQV